MCKNIFFQENLVNYKKQARGLFCAFACVVRTLEFGGFLVLLKKEFRDCKQRSFNRARFI
jgi:hypothetical protein